MQTTNILQLPIYNTPTVDTFNIADVNTAHENLEAMALGLATNPEYVTLINQEVENARGGQANLNTRLNGVDASLGNITKKTNINLTPSMFNVVGDGIIDDSDALQSMFTFAKANGGIILFPRNGVYRITKTLLISAGLNIYFNNCSFKFYEGTYINSYAMLIDTVDGITWVGRTYMDFTRIDKLYAQSYTTTTQLKLMSIGCGIDLINITTYGFYQTATWCSAYIDYAYVEGSQINNHLGTLFALSKTGGNGDQVFFKNCHLTSSTNLNHIKVSASLGLKIEGTINGNIEVYRCEATIISNSHLEQGNIYVNDSSASLDNNFIYKRAGVIPIVIKDSRSPLLDNMGRSVNLNNNTFILKYLWENYSTENYDVDIDSYNGRISLNNNTREVEVSGGDYQFAYLSSINVKTSTGSFGITQPVCQIVRTKLLDNSIHSNFMNGTDDGYSILNNVTEAVTGVLYTDGVTNNGNSYSYVAGHLFSPTMLTGCINKDVIKTVTLALGKGVRIFLNKPYTGLDGFIRIYKGATPHNYTQYVDIPCPNTNSLVDNGYGVNGYLWITRPVGEITIPNKCYGYNTLGYTTISYMQNIPNIGTWIKESKVVCSIPTAGGYEGWICLTSGTQGTLSGVTGDITTGTKLLTTNTVTGLMLGNIITIAGVAGTKTITAIDTVNKIITVDTNADATVTTGAVAYSPAVFKGYGLIQA